MRAKTILSLLCFLTCLGALLFSPSCANTSTPPSGGRKDTIPPILVRTIPSCNAVNFSAKHIELKFNEFPKINDAINQIYLSPPQAKRPVAVVRGKSVVVTFAAPLDTNTTYSLHFGQSIVDNNEGNPFGDYTFSFSTGKHIDSLLCSGYVVDARTLLPVDNISILLHTEVADTTLYKTLPRALAKTDFWGYFSLLNLKGVPSHLFAVEDLNRNNKYEDNNERVAFSDSLFLPINVMNADSLARRIDPKDTLTLLARPVERVLYLFKEATKRQVLREKVRPQSRLLLFTFSAPDAQINSLQINGVDTLLLIREHTLKGDTIRYWLQGEHLPDTLKGVVNYMKTDSLNQLSTFEEKFSLSIVAPKKQEESNTRRARTVVPDTARTDVLKIDLTANPELVEQTGILFSFSAYPAVLNIDSLILRYTTARNEETKIPYTFVKDSLNGCLYKLIPEKWVPNVSYEVRAPRSTFKDVYGFESDSLSYKFTLPEAGKSGSVSFTLQGGQGMYMVELLDKTREKVVRAAHLSAGGKGKFPYLSDGIYVIRITEDRNGNGVWDTGSLDRRIQPERVRFYKLANGIDLIEISNKLELEQTIDIEELFNYDVTPIVPNKTQK